MTSGGKIRVLHLIGSNFVGGPEKQILRHAQDLSSSPYEIWVGSFRDAGERAEVLREAEALGLPTIELLAGRFSLSSVTELRAKMREHGISLLCTYHYKANILGKLVSLMGTKHIAFVRGWTGETARVRFYVILERLVLRTIDHVVCVSSAQARKIRSWRGRRPELMVIGNSPVIDATESAPGQKESSRRELNVSASAYVLGLVGRLSPEKGHPDLLRTLPGLRKIIPGLEVWVLGEGQEKDALLSLAAELEVKDIVRFLGFKKDVRHWIQAMDILVQPSHTEGMPNSVLEAMAIGTPVIATAVGGLPEMLRSGTEGTLIPPVDGNALREAITAYYQDPERAKSHAACARERVRHSRAAHRDSLLALYDRVLKRERTVTAPRFQDNDPFISIVIPVRNEARHIVEVLSALARQDYSRDRFEIIVADGNSTDETAQLVRDFAKIAEVPVHVVPNPRQLSSAGRNAGALASRGDVIAFIDGHCHIPNDHLLSNIVDAFRRSGTEILCRPQPLQVQGNTLFQDALAHTRATIIGHGADSTIFATDREQHVNPSSSGAIYTAAVFEQIGMYDENFDACEDVEFNFRAWKAGLKGFSSPSVAVNYSPRTGFVPLWKQLVRYGRGRLRLIRKHPEALTLPQLVPAAFLAWLVIFGAGAWFSPLAAGILAGTLGVYGCTILLFAICLGFRYGWHHLWFSPGIYFCIHLGLGAGFWRELLTPSANPRLPEIRWPSARTDSDPQARDAHKQEVTTTNR